MIIDFHTHIFPDKIAKKTIDLLAEKGGVPPFSDGTVDRLLRQMDAAGVDISVTLPVLTKPSQFESVNGFAAEINRAFEGRLISFAGIHPRCEDIDKKMKFIKESGFRGVKIHPDYQETFITDEGYLRIMECAKEYDLIVITHAGADAGYRGVPVKCPPKLALELIRRVRHPKLVLAHYGANEMFPDVLETLCGEDVYFDTAYILRFIGEDTFKKILKKHGEDRILFATDSPWSDIKNDINIIKSFNLDKNTEKKLFCENAKKLLGI